MKQQLTILTGASRGMGAAIAELLLQPGHTVIGLSRATNADLQAKAAAVCVGSCLEFET